MMGEEDKKLPTQIFSQDHSEELSQTPQEHWQMTGTKMKRQIMKRKMLHFSDKIGRVIVVYKLSSQN